MLGFVEQCSSSSIEMIIWFLSCILLIWHIEFIDFPCWTILVPLGLISPNVNNQRVLLLVPIFECSVESVCLCALQGYWSTTWWFFCARLKLSISTIQPCTMYLEVSILLLFLSVRRTCDTLSWNLLWNSAVKPQLFFFFLSGLAIDSVPT